MHVGSTIVEPDLCVGPAAIMVVADMAGLMHVLNAMDKEPEREPTILDGLSRVLQGRPKLIDLGHDATVLRIIGRELGIVPGFIERHVDIVPGRGLAMLATVVIGPGRGVCDRLPFWQQGRDAGLRPRSQVLVRDPSIEWPGRHEAVSLGRVTGAIRSLDALPERIRYG